MLSGKLLKNPPVRGPFGEAKINIMPGATPKRQRSFKMVGEREAAFKEILEDYIEKGWLEPSFSEWGSLALWSPRKSKEIGDWWWTIAY